MKHTLFGAVVLMAAINTQAATTVTLSAVADTTLHDAFATNNLGASVAMAAGATGQGTARALVRFDLSSIPANATITSVKLLVNCDRAAAGPGTTFELHRMLKSWTEGDKVGDRRLTGAPASAGEVTWSHQIYQTTPWEVAGAGGANDADTNISSSVLISGVGAFTFPSSASLLADVQAWRTTPSANFGWLIKSGSEEIDGTARTFTTKEANNPMRLEIIYDNPVVTELRIATFQFSNGTANLTWTGGAPPYRIERAANITGPWTTFPTTTQTQGSAPLEGSINFFRVAGQVP